MVEVIVAQGTHVARISVFALCAGTAVEGEEAPQADQDDAMEEDEEVLPHVVPQACCDGRARLRMSYVGRDKPFHNVLFSCSCCFHKDLH